MSHIRKRKHSVLVRLNDWEHAHLQNLVFNSGLAQETLLRQIIIGYQVKAAPPIEYHKMIHELSRIGHNINQIGAKLNALHRFDKTEFNRDYDQLMKMVLVIQNIYEVREKQSC